METTIFQVTDSKIIRTHFSALICGKDGTIVFVEPTFRLDDTDEVSAITFSPSDFNWSTKESTSLDLPPSFIALELKTGLLENK